MELPRICRRVNGKGNGDDGSGAMGALERKVRPVEVEAVVHAGGN